MQAVLFPVTYIAEPHAEALKTCFRQILVYQPTRRQVPPLLQTLSRGGLIELRIPVDSDEKKLETLVSGYRNWAALHEGGALEYMKLQQGTVPFFEDSSIARIRTDIRQAAAGKRAASPPPGPLFNARVFLQIAQEYDLQSEEIARKLAAAHEAERKLFAGITGEAAPEAKGPRSGISAASDLSPRMVAARTAAWAQLFLRDRPAAWPRKPTAFVTVDPAFVDFLLERTPTAEEVLQVRSIPLAQAAAGTVAQWHSRLEDILDNLPPNAAAAAAELVSGLPSAPGDRKIDLRLYRVRGEAPAAFFARTAGQAPPPEAARTDPESQTIVGLVETTT